MGLMDFSKATIAGAVLATSLTAFSGAAAAQTDQDYADLMVRAARALDEKPAHPLAFPKACERAYALRAKTSLDAFSETNAIFLKATPDPFFKAYGKAQIECNDAIAAQRKYLSDRVTESPAAPRMQAPAHN